MPKYLIHHQHTLADCLRILDAFEQAGAHFLRATDWGCHAGSHASWIVVEADNDSDARLMIPPVIRKDAVLVKLNKFTPEEIRGLHEKMAAQ